MIIGTAGHVDHGKTALVKALTGIDTDRLPQEKERGLSIELGFAHLDLPSGRRAGIVDVPGHEKFVRQMVAGATGMDLALLVVAADEGVMPQTAEHLEILQLLGVQRGLIALTKADLVEPEMLELVRRDVAQAVRGTFLEGSPMLAVSAVTGEGLQELVKAMDGVAAETRERDLAAPFRLPIDRVFTISGFGTVVTGTLAAGRLRVNEAVEILPPGIESRVRGLRVHGQAMEVVEAGERVAANLTGVETREIARGDVVTQPGVFRPTRMLDARLTYLAGAPRPLAHGTRVRVHLGTAEILARAAPMESDTLAPGATGLVQLRLEAPTVAAKGQPLIARSYSPARTIGGGIVLDPYARRHRGRETQRAGDLEFLAAATPEQILEREAASAPGVALDAAAVAAKHGMSRERVAEIVGALVQRGALRRFEPGAVVVHGERFEAFLGEVVAALEAFHAREPLRGGMASEALREALATRVESRVLHHAVAELEARGRVQRRDGRLAIAGRQIAFTPAQKAIAERIERAYLEHLFATPLLEEVIARQPDPLAAREVARALHEQGALHTLEDVTFHRAALERAYELIVEYLQKRAEMTVAAFRDLIGSTRKYAMPLLRHFDAIGVTRRRGDDRVLGPRWGRAPAR